MESQSGGISCTRLHEHAVDDYHDFETSPNASACCYNPGPDDSSGVINASAYRAFLLTAASIDFSDESLPKDR